MAEATIWFTTCRRMRWDYETSEAVRHFVRMWAGGPPVAEADGKVGMRAVEVLDAMYRTFGSGRTETVKTIDKEEV